MQAVKYNITPKGLKQLPFGRVIANIFGYIVFSLLSLKYRHTSAATTQAQVG